jgi:signal transduction histidine kinase
VQVLVGVAHLALKSPDPRRWKSALDLIRMQCEDLAETTQAFLAFVNRRGAEEVGSFRIADDVAQCVRLVEPLAKNRGVMLERRVEEDGAVSGERRMAVQAVVNLASNAVVACAASRGTVTITASRPAPCVCRLTVSDTGPGIPEPIRARLFRPFVTTGAATGGNGLGLFIVRQAVRDLGGSIKVRTSPEGTTIHLDLPRTEDGE